MSPRMVRPPREMILLPGILNTVGVISFTIQTINPIPIVATAIFQYCCFSSVLKIFICSIFWIEMVSMIT